MYLRVKNLKDYWAVDIETDSLTPTIVRCCVAKNMATQQIIKMKDKDEIQRFFTTFKSDYFIGHNFISFDAPTLHRLLGIRVALSRIVDTLVLSYLFHPYIEDGHSLESWGERVGVRKVIVPDFANVSDADLLRRCESDVEITQRTYLYLQDVMLKIGYSELSCEIEHWTRHIINEQEKNGFYFNITGAEQLYSELRNRQSGIEQDIQHLFPPRLVEQGNYDFRFKQDGTPFASYQRHLDKYPKLVTEGNKYSVWDWEHFNLASPNQRVSRLLDLGWTPTKFTKPSKSHPNGQPQVDEDSLVEAAQALQKPELKAMAEWLVCFGRGNMLNNWLQTVNREDSKMHGVIWTCGALSRRMRHTNPNTTTIPGNESKYGLECRALWQATPGRVLLGFDAKGIQMRIMGHYTDLFAQHPEIFQLYLGKPHQRNADLIGNGCTYKQAKNDFFAFIFGCYDEKLGKMHNKSPKPVAVEYGKYVRSKLFESVPGIKEATDNAQQEFKQNKGRMKCLDGGYVLCPSSHAAFNYQVQPGEAVVMKLTAINHFKKKRKEGLDAKLVGFSHDENQTDCVDEKTAQRCGELAEESIQEAGEMLNLKVPMGINFAIGKNWAETHS